MSTHILGIGLGLFILITFWVIAIVCCIASHRTYRKLGVFAIIVASLLTCVLILIPKEDRVPTVTSIKVYDTLFVWRVSLNILLGISAVAVIALFIVTHLMEVHRAQPIRNWKFSQVVGIE